MTVIRPHPGNVFQDKVPAAVFVGNAFGKLAGSTQVDELGTLETPIALTNTLAVGAGVEGAVRWTLAQAGNEDVRSVNALVGETNDAGLNDIRALTVRPAHVLAALAAARTGAVEEGSVGAGTGTRAFGWKGGIGTASRRLPAAQGGYTLGVLVQANYGLRDSLLIAGAPVGQHLRNDRIYSAADDAAGDTGSIIIVIATDAPLLPHQLERISRRAGMGLARMGSNAGNGSGDLFVAFSTANQAALAGGAMPQATFLANDQMDPLFVATVQATEEAITNALIAARDMQGTEGHYAKAINHEALTAVLKRYGRLVE